MTDSQLALADVDIAGIDKHPADESVKLNGPPGTGKTTNSAARVAKLIRDHGYSIGDVVWITYRKSLAMDTLRRLSRWGVVSDEELSSPGDGATRFIGTAHAVANRCVGGVGEPVGYGDKKQFCERRNLKFDKSTPWETPAGQLLFDVFDYAKKNLLDPTSKADLRKIPGIDDLRKKYQGSIPRAYQDWEDHKDENEKVDFWEMLEAPLKTGLTPGKSILVIDEYHDAYPQMAKLAEMWAESADIVIVAGDPLQVVNTYEGADPSFYRRIDYPEILLPRTYRVPYEHWKPATWLLATAHQPPRIDRQSRGMFAIQRSPTFSHTESTGWNVPDPNREFSPAWLINEYGGDTMFLTRTVHQLDGIARSLEKAGMLFQVPTSSDAKDWAAGPGEDENDRVAIYNALQKIKRLSQASFDGIDAGLSEYDQGAMGLDRYGGGAETNPDDVVLSAIEAATLLDRSNAKHLSENRSDITEVVTDWISEDSPITATEINEYVKPDFWTTFTQASRSTHYLNQTSRLGGKFDSRDIDAIKVALQENDSPVDGSIPTKVFTIHASKGNEAQNVVVYDGITSRIQRAMDNDEAEYKNEYRTWYVAFTRAKKNLFVLKDGFDFTKRFLPSPGQLKEQAAKGYDEAEKADDAEEMVVADD
jgi:DNA helicase-2/ATP-dependent DNA helicase PcrA